MSRSDGAFSAPKYFDYIGRELVGSRFVREGHNVTKEKGKGKVGKVMREFKAGKLHSGSKHGPAVTNPKQATAIALSEARKAGANIPRKKS